MKYTLISMVSYTLRLRGMTMSELFKAIPNTFHELDARLSATENANLMVANDAILWMLTGEYAKFLRQLLELWMFVPCDKDGNVLEEPVFSPLKMSDTNVSNTHSNKVKQYQLNMFYTSMTISQ